MSTTQLPLLGARPDSGFPPSEQALAKPNGLLAWGGDLDTRRLLDAYRQGIFPWYSEGEPVLWWTPDPRCVLFPENVYISKRTRRRFNSDKHLFSADTAFDAVIDACAETRGGSPGTWITADLKSAFTELHRLGHAHSVEVWNGTKLVGGIYGLAIGSVFFGESMFSRETDASKLALVALCRQLHAWSFKLLDCQVTNPHLLSMGAIEIPRAEFKDLLDKFTLKLPRRGSWSDGFSVDERW